MLQRSSRLMGPLHPRLSLRTIQRAFSSADEQFVHDHFASAIGRTPPHVTFTRGEGSWLYDDQDQSYLDFTCGIGVTNTGHAHPKVVKAVQEQVPLVSHMQVNIGTHKPMIELSKRLLKIMPDPSLDSFFFVNSGSEAVEAALKAARQFTRKQNVIVFSGSFHGRTIGAMSMTTSKTCYRSNVGPLMPSVVVAPHPYCHHCPAASLHASGCCEEPLRQFDLLFKTQTTPDETAAVIIEPVLGEGGYVYPPPSFLSAIQKRCNEHNIMFIADEVQSGFGRTGRMFAVEHYNVVPDIMVIAKGIASGYPLAGIATRREIMDAQKPGSMGGTYGGNAVACAAGVGTIDALIEENMLKNTQERGEQLLEGLHHLKEKHGSLITDIRGKGLMVAMEFDSSKSGVAGAVVQKCRENKLLLLTCGPREAIRFIPPLNINASDLDEGVKRFTLGLEQAIAEL